MESYLYSYFWLSVWYLILVYAFKLTFVHLWLNPRRIEKHFAKQGIKGPKYNFFLGNIKEIVSLAMGASSHPMPLSHDILPRVLSFYHHWKKMYGSTFLVWFGPTPRLTIVDPDLIKDIFIYKSELFEKNESPPLVRKLEGDGLLSLQGEKWAHHRKIMTPLFYMENIKLMIPSMEKSIKEMTEQWSSDIMSSTTGKVEVEVSKSFERLTEDVITRTVFGSSYGDGKAIFELQSQQMVYAIEAYQKVFIPGFRYLPTKKNRISWKLDKQIKTQLMKLINKREKYSRDGPEGVSEECPKDLLELMIKASRSNCPNRTCVLGQTKQKGNCTCSSSSKITAHDTVEECKTIFFAGKHTTSNLMTWTTVMLAMHPQWQEMAREEVLRICGARDPPTHHHIANLKMLDMITKESLRLYPPAVATIRRAKVDAHLGDLTIPNGTELLIPILAVHHDSNLWGQDAIEFNPSRFSKGATKYPMTFLPFGLGARRCIGQNLAIVQAKLAMIMILQRFSFHLSPNYKHAPTVLMLLHPQYGAPIIFQKL